MKVTGTVQFRDIEGGVWVLAADNGQTYQLAGGDRRLKRNGARVEVDGRLNRAAVTVGMVGPVFNVSRYKFV